MKDEVVENKIKLLKIAKCKSFTHKERYYLLKRTIKKMNIEDKKLLKYELERELESLEKGTEMVELISQGLSVLAIIVTLAQLSMDNGLTKVMN